jgi:hypothetical protein
MAQYRVLASEGRQRYSVYRKKERKKKYTLFWPASIVNPLAAAAKMGRLKTFKGMQLNYFVCIKIQEKRLGHLLLTALLLI